jgi:HPt (histidine-containing phosphotransfer) domain-containing protein
MVFETIGTQKITTFGTPSHAPITYFISNVKSSQAMLDLEQTLKELGSFVKRLTDDKEENIQQILNRKKGICEEIHKIRKSFQPFFLHRLL